MRKVSAVLCSVFATAAVLAVLAVPVGAGSYPPSSTVPTVPPTTVVPPPSTTTPTVPSTTTPTVPSSTVAPPTVAPTAAAAQAGTLAFTGSDSKPLFVIGIIAVALGAVFVVAARRRSSVQAPKAG